MSTHTHKYIHTNTNIHKKYIHRNTHRNMHTQIHTCVLVCVVCVVWISSNLWISWEKLLTHSTHEHCFYFFICWNHLLSLSAMYCIFFFLDLALILLKFSLSMFFVLLCKIFLKNYFPIFTLLMYVNIMDFCWYCWYPTILFNYSIPLEGFCSNSLEYSMYLVMSFANKGRF